MTMNTNTAGGRNPTVRGDQVLLFDANDGFTGHLALDGEARQIALTRKMTSRCVVFDLANVDGNAVITGTAFQTEAPGTLGKSGKPLPYLNGRLTVAGPNERTFDFAVWHMIAASGCPYYFGSIKPLQDSDVPMAAAPMSAGRSNIVPLSNRLPQ